MREKRIEEREGTCFRSAMAHFEKDFRQLCRQINSIGDGQARVSRENIFSSSTPGSPASDSSDSEESPSSQSFYLEISPRDGPYAHGSFVFCIEASPDSPYPECQPIVSCLTRLYHPNIDTTHRNRHNNVCVSVLNDWDGGPQSTFEDLLQGLMFLFHSPNPDDPLTSNVSSELEEFSVNARISIEGGLIEDFDAEPFEMNYGYRKYVAEQEQQQTGEEDKLSDKLVHMLTREPNFKELFSADTLEFLMNSSASSLVHQIRHNKEPSTHT